MVPADVLELPMVSELEVSPRGDRAIYGVLAPDADADAYINELWELNLADSTAKPLALAESGAYAARFSPDGRELAWLEDGEENTLLVVARVAGGKRKVVVKSADGISEFAWAPDGQGFVLVKSDPVPDDDQAVPYVITRSLAQSDGGGYSDERRTHLHWIDRRKSGAAAMRALTSGPWDDSDVAISPARSTPGWRRIR